jgi:hypothetical protein
MYNVPLTLKTDIPKGWKNVIISQAKNRSTRKILCDKSGCYIRYKALPNSSVTISRL